MTDDSFQLTPHDIRGHEFSRTFRGYDPVLVESFQQRVSEEFERLLRETVDATYPERERDQFMAHFKGLTDLWAADNKH